MAQAAKQDPKPAAKPFLQPKYTLIEVMVSLVFLLVICGLMFRFVSDMHNKDETDLRRAREGVMLLNSTIGAYAFDLSKLPPRSKDGGLQVIIDAGYIDAVPLDPWGQPYQYRSPSMRSGRNFDLYSRGPDGVDSVMTWCIGTCLASRSMAPAGSRVNVMKPRAERGLPMGVAL